jgi:response regulator RpfG family c-di-GMP phosphodiesterase
MLHSLAVPGVASWVRSHHEHWDGTGFPDALRGHSIPIEARIIALADAYDNMTSALRPGGALSKAAALQDIDQSIGTRFDPSLADKFIRVVASTEALGWSDEWPAA